ncbi:MAG TPA: hypothetical protein VD927_02040 [Chryseosolibacter sp.]|nr:hypothetical protein [Chryseosolibacter sp.]
MPQTRKILFLLFVLSHASSFAQNRLPGTIITKSGDTLNVFILKSTRYTNSEKVSYTQYVASKEVKSYSPAEVTLFYSDAGYFQSIKNSSGNPSFLRRMSYGGPAVLFSGIDAKGYPTFHLLIDSVLTTLHHADLSGQLKKTLTGCSKLNTKGPYEQYFLQDLVSRYNACVNPEKVVYAKRRRPVIATGGFKAGPNYNTVEYFGFSDNALGYSAGIFLDFSVVERMSFQLELNYLKVGQEGDFNAFSYAQLPLILEINVPVNPESRLNLYFQGGLSYNYRLSEEMFSAQYVGGSENFPFRLKPKAIGSLASVGVSKDLRFRKAVYFELRYESLNQKLAFSSFSGEAIKINSLQLSAGINF